MRALGGGASSVRTDSTMLTGDWNIIHVSFVVLCRIQDPATYLFNLQSPEMTVKEVAESAVRETVGGSEIRPFSRARQRTKDTAQKLMQDMLDQHSGAKRSTASPGGFVYLGDGDVGEFVVRRFFLIQDLR
jgi:modulator of FtsH protease HflK